jgi:hypothetical protein
MRKLSSAFILLLATTLSLVFFSAAVLAGGGLAGNWAGQETFTMESPIGLPESGTTPIPIVVTADGTLYTTGSSPGGIGLSGKIDAGGNFSGTYLTQDGTRFSITGAFSGTRATLTKQPVIPKGTSGVNITFELTYAGGAPDNQNTHAAPGTQSNQSTPNSFPDVINQAISWVSGHPVQFVTGVVAGLATLGLLSTVVKLAGRGASASQARNIGGKIHKPERPPSKIIQRGPTYSPTSSSQTTDTTADTPLKVIGPEDAAGGTPISGSGAYAMPVNQGRVGVQVGSIKSGVGAPWNNGNIEQPDANYTPSVHASWATTVTRIEAYSDHFFVTFSTPAPSDAYFDWVIRR